MKIPATDLLNSIFPKNAQEIIYSAVSRAYSIVEKTMRDTLFLSSPAGKNCRPSLKNAAVEFELQKLAQIGALPFVATEGINVANNCRHLELLSLDASCILTTSQVPRATDLPREAKFRQTLGVGNGQLPLFAEEDYHDGLPCHILLTHGYQTKEPLFVSIGIPDAGNKEWLGRMQLNKTGLEVIENDTDIEDTDYESFALALKNGSLGKGLQSDERE